MSINARKKKGILIAGSRAQRFFQELVDELDLLMTFGYRPTKVMRYGMQGIRNMRAAKERKWQREVMRRLAERKLIVVTKVAEQYCIALTTKGAEEVLRERIRKAGLLSENKTCFVIFDIPESHKHVRQLLRRFLTDIGFAQLQKSVWICRFDLADLLSELFTQRDEKQWIRVFTAEEK